MGKLALSLTSPDHAWAAEGNFNDSGSIGGITGTNVGGVTFGTGKVGQAFSLSGSSQSVDLGTGVGNFGTADFSVSVWVQPIATGSNEPVVVKRAPNSAGIFNLTVQPNGTLLVEIRDNGGGPDIFYSFTGTQNLANGQWHHLALTRQGATIAVYIDGAPASGSGSSAGGLNLSSANYTSQHFIIGANPFGQYYKGLIDEFNIYGSALSSAQVQSLYASAGGTPPPTTYTITSSAGANGSISASATVNSGASSTFTITPAAGYHVADVLVDGSSVGAVSSYTFTNVTANHTIAASFAINVNQPPVLADPGPKTVNEGQTLIFNVSATDPDAGQTVTITATGLPAGATFANGTFSWRPTFNQSGTYPMTFTATDNGSPVQSVSQTVQIAVNDVPAISAPSGLVSLWSAEGNANDAAGQNNGAAQGGVSYGSGMIGQAFSFDGTSKYVGVASPANIPVDNSTYAIAAWIKPQSYNVFGIVGWGNYGATNQVNAFRLHSGGYLINYWWANDLIVQTGVNLADGQFHHVVAMYDGSTRSIWVDGVMRGRDTPSGHNVPNAGNFRIGSTNNGEYFNGLVDEVAIFNRALSASEIQTIYASGGLVPDSSPPAVTPVVTGTLGQNGWYVSAVNVSWTLSDPESGIASSTGASTTNLTQDNAGTTLVCTATNGAGLTTTKSVTVKIDQTPPTISATRSPAANANGWNNSDVTVSFQVGDALSGVASIVSPKVVSTEGAGQSASGTVTDRAGNTATAILEGINIDKTPPTVSISRSPAANANGWNNTNVMVSFVASDGPSGSGVAVAPAAVVISGEGAGQFAKGEATDLAGNSATAILAGINIDKTAPTISASRSPAANANGWNNTDVTVSFAVSDGLSGFATTPGPVTLSQDGANQSASGTATDKAGNSATATLGGINIDKTAPTVTAALTAISRSRDEDEDEDGNFYRITATATDLLDPHPSVSAQITQPLTSSTGMTVSYKKEKKNRIQIQTEKKKLVVKLEGPSEQALRTLWSQVLGAGGFAVSDGQTVQLVLKKDKKDEYEAKYQFDSSLKLTSAQGPGLSLVVSARDAAGNQSPLAKVVPNKSGSAKMVSDGSLPTSFSLEPSYPNPFNPSTTLRYNLVEAGQVQLTVYNVMGQQVRILIDQVQEAGGYQVEWDATDASGQRVAPGLYLYRLVAGDQAAVGKMLLLK